MDVGDPPPPSANKKGRQRAGLKIGESNRTVTTLAAGPVRPRPGGLGG